MKRFLYVLLAMLTFTACANSSKRCPAPVEEFITNLYSNYVFNYGELDSIAENFSPELLERLRQAYADEYCDGEPGYAVWLFRTSQNGSDDQRLDSIVVNSRDHYTAHITDAGTPCTCQMHIVMRRGTPVLLDFTTRYDAPNQDF